MRKKAWVLCALIALWGVPARFSSAGQGARERDAGLRTTLLSIADRWVESWVEKEWDEAKGVFKFRHGPYSDAFEHHYVAAVLLNTPESKLHRSESLARRTVGDLVYHSRVLAEQCGERGLRGYWALNSASAKGVPVGSGSWQSRSYIRACRLLDPWMTAEQRRIWREGAKGLIAALTVDWKETFGPWWSTNKVADHVAGVALWHQVSGDPQAKEFLDRQFEWFWRAFPEEGCADKYHNYFAKTLYRLSPILFVPEARRYHEALLRRIKMWRSFVAPNGLYDAALHGEPNSEEAWFGKLGPVLAILLLAAPHDPELALVARHIVEQRLADSQTEGFWRGRFEAYFGGHWGSLGLIIESAPLWEEAVLRARPGRPGRFEQLRFFDYWRGLGRLAVKTDRYQASSYLHWAWTWNFAPLGGTLHHLYTSGAFRFSDLAPGRSPAAPRTETARCWLDWDPHQDPETGRERVGLVAARSGDLTLSLPPDFPDEAVVSGIPEGRLYGFTHCRYRLAETLEVRTSNVFLNDAVIVLNTVTALKDASWDILYVQQSLANPGDLAAVLADGRVIQFESANVSPKPSVSHPVGGRFELRGRDGKGALGFVTLAHSFVRQELVDVALVRSPYGDVKRVPHRVEAWRGYLPVAVRKGEVFLADFAYAPRDPRDGPVPTLDAVRTEQAHGVIVRGEPAVAVGQSMTAGGRAGFAIGDFRCEGDLFAAEFSGSAVGKASLYGRSLSHRDQPVVGLGREAAVTALPTGEGRVDTALGPIEVRTPKGTSRLFSVNHEFPRAACTSLDLRAGGGEPAASRPSDVEAACRSFASLPERVEVAALLAELEFLQRSAEARAPGGVQERDRLARARQALASGDAARARSLGAAAQKGLLAVHEAADRARQPVVAANPRDATALLPPQVAGQDRAPKTYLISFAEERGRDLLMRRAEELCRAAAGRPETEGLCAAVRDAEQVLLTRYFGLPIRWTREHVPGQPDFFWRPVLLGGEKGRDGLMTDWEKALGKYIAPGDQAWLALTRLEGAVTLIAE